MLINKKYKNLSHSNVPIPVKPTLPILVSNGINWFLMLLVVPVLKIYIMELYNTYYFVSGFSSQDFPRSSVGKASARNAGDLGSISGLGSPPGEGNGNPLQYSYLENPMDIGPWQVTVYGITKRWTRLSTIFLHSNSLRFINIVAVAIFIFIAL